MGGSRRKKIERHLAEDEIDELIAEVEDSHELKRLIFIKSLYKGDTLEEAADRVGRSDATGSRWAKQWNKGGIEGIMPDFGGGRPPKLSEEEQEQLLALLKEGEPWTSQEIRHLIQKEFNVSYHPAYLSSFLRSLGLKYAKPRPQRPSRPDNAKDILNGRVENALDDDETPQNIREDDEQTGWELDEDIVTDGGTVVGFFRRSMATTDR